MNVVQDSIILNAAVADVYARWLRFEDVPQFIKPMRNVHPLLSHDSASQYLADFKSLVEAQPRGSAAFEC